MPACASIFVNVFFRISAKVFSAFPKYLLTPPPSYEMHPKDPFEVDTVPFEFCIAGVNRMMSGLLRKMKKKRMAADAFVLFFPVGPEFNGGSYTVDVLGDRHAELILMRSCLNVEYLFLEVLMQFPYSLLFI